MEGLSVVDLCKISGTVCLINIQNSQVQFTFSRLDGLLTNYKVQHTNFIQDGFNLKPNFWRPPTDNDFGAGLQKKLQNWKRASHNYVMLGFEIDSTNNKLIKLSVHYALPDVFAFLDLHYEINGDGMLKVTETMHVDHAKQEPILFKFGMQMMLPKKYNQMEWYGRGPSENYWDRKDAAFVGVYNINVHDQFHPYLRPQETGNKTDIRWMQLTDKNGSGLWISGDTVLNITARHFLDKDLDDGLEKHNSHAGELKERDLTVLSIDLQQTGVGGINSWGTWPLEKYQLKYKDYSYTFIIKPIQ
ncbi:MAG: hypothetical protein K2W79_11060 [Hydrotalea flava]|uniref:beta-galactosidase small subunit n=1 Tax=Hydrotalea TaxID=1004300 RepID=UPI001C44001A|nr:MULTISPECIES: beta-galactosidase small subunit [Hydrotalea]MBY0348786.1 hypothetical protein [Hydrotalea flava]GHT57227.1 hypothetical protein FACS18945_0980 [Bacteroidia bacterium]